MVCRRVCESGEDEEGPALVHGWRGGREVDGGVVIFSQKCPHLKSSLGDPSLYVYSQLLLHTMAVSGPHLCGAISSASVRVCVWGREWVSASKACMYKCVCMPAPDYPLSLLNTTLFHSSSFYHLPHRTLFPRFCHLFLYFHLVSVSALFPAPPPLYQKSKHQFCMKDRETLMCERMICSLSLAAVTPGWACWFHHLCFAVNGPVTLII